MITASGQRVVILTTAACLVGMILKTIWPAMVLPEVSFTLYAAILILAHISSPRIENRRDMGWEWMISVLALTFLPAAAGLHEEALWKIVLVDAVFSLAVILVLDSMDRRAALRRTGRVAFLVNGVLFLFAIQGFEHMLM